jgi:hypothetical protein
MSMYSPRAPSGVTSETAPMVGSLYTSRGGPPERLCVNTRVEPSGRTVAAYTSKSGRSRGRFGQWRLSEASSGVRSIGAEPSAAVRQ